MGVRGSGEWLGVEMGDPVGEKVYELLDKIIMSTKIGIQRCMQRQNDKNVQQSKYLNTLILGANLSANHCGDYVNHLCCITFHYDLNPCSNFSVCFLIENRVCSVVHIFN